MCALTKVVTGVFRLGEEVVQNMVGVGHDGYLCQEVANEKAKCALRFVFVGFLNTLLTGLHACHADAITFILSTLHEKVGYKILLYQRFLIVESEQKVMLGFCFFDWLLILVNCRQVPALRATFGCSILFTLIISTVTCLF